MTSKVNTNQINKDFPIPGVNNSSQGFRDNFSQIKNALSVAKTEISEIHSKSVFKSAIDGTILDNDMGGSLLSNFLTKGQQYTVYSQGSNLSGHIVVDLSLGSVHIGTMTSDIDVIFKNWAGSDKYSEVLLQLKVVPSLVINFLQAPPCNSVYKNLETIPGGDSINNRIVVPNNIDEIHLKCYSIDCGETIFVQLLNETKVAKILGFGTPANMPITPSNPGEMLWDADYLYICVSPGVWHRIAHNSF
jgi:hypothetical protein